MTVSLEIVPRSKEAIEADLDVLTSMSPQLRMVNVPDLLRFSLRSWQACGLARRRGFRAIPHIRAMDFPPDKVPTLARALRENQVTEVLVIHGDAPQDPTHSVYQTTSVDLIRDLTASDPQLKVFAGFDPYRRGLRAELDVVKEKLAAGAAGLFTQPFFDLRFAELCAELVPKTEVFWGVSPILSDANRSYWEITNKVFIPPSLQHSLEWHTNFARRFVSWTRSIGGSVYLMPIRVDLRTYLSGLFHERSGR